MMYLRRCEVHSGLHPGCRHWPVTTLQLYWFIVPLECLQREAGEAALCSHAPGAVSTSSGPRSKSNSNPLSVSYISIVLSPLPTFFQLRTDLTQLVAGWGGKGGHTAGLHVRQYPGVLSLLLRAETRARAQAGAVSVKSVSSDKCVAPWLHH